jgi:hypothetical protein
MSNENTIKNLIRVDDKTNPTLFRALQLMIDDLYKINNEVFPPPSTSTTDQTSSGGKILPPPANFIGIAYPDNLRLDWDDLDGAFRYEIRMGNDWDTAKRVLVTASDVANEDPIYLHLIYGTYNFLLRGINVDGKLGDTAEAVLIVPQIGPPNLTVEAVVSTVLLRWTAPASAWRIDYYIVYKNGLQIGTISGTFKLIQEQIGGTYSYSVRAVDIVGNLGTMSTVQTIVLHDPSEFAFIGAIPAVYNGSYVHTQFAKINGVPGVLGPTDVRLWHEHFEVNGFISPQDQYDKGYTLYYQPSVDSGYYVEQFDFGSIQKNVKIVVDYAKFQVYGSTDIATYFRYSDDGATWTDWIQGESILVPSFRYVQVQWLFTNQDDKSAAFISALQVLINITLALDSGPATALATDVGGTLVTYNKTFIGVNSVTATPSVSLQPLYAVCDQINKTNFRVLVFDSSGNRHDASVTWKARGVV